jgi:uncharacterized sulfatase
MLRHTPVYAILIFTFSLAGYAGERPNIIHIMADDLGYGDLGSYGQETLSTPNLDQMAREGMRFTQYYAGNTVCRPSRAALRFGQHPGNAPVNSNAKFVVQPDDITVTSLLDQAGYTIGGVGKWALGYADTVGAPFKLHHDMWFGYLQQGAAHNYYPQFLWNNDRLVTLDNKVKYTKDYRTGLGGESGHATQRHEYSHDLMVDRAMQFVRENQDGPFYLEMHVTIPHANNEGKPQGMEVPDAGPYSNKDWPAPEKGFAGMVHRLDRDVGQMIDLLEKLEIDEDTVVFFTSDNGPHKEGGHKATFFDSNGPLRGIKRDLYEGGIRVPLIVRWPGQIEPGTTSDHLAAFWDFMPTVADLAGIQTPTHSDGLSYLPTLLGDEDKQEKHDFLYWDFQTHSTGSRSHAISRAVRMGKWKAVQPKTGDPIELYNLQKDLGEQNNIADQHPGVVAEARSIFKRYGDEDKSSATGRMIHKSTATRIR